MDKYLINEEEKDILTFFIIKGIPEHYRMRLWILSSGALNQIKLNSNYYSKLLELSKEVPSLYSDIIRKDIDRTNTQNPELKKKLNNILICYSIRNSSIGYCQGFNYIALMILEIIKDEVILFLFNAEY
jgi:predicted methyltransferase